MDIDLYSKAVHLLEKIANSVHERDPKNPNLLCFSITEVHLVEKWLEEFIQEHRK
jgi:hypothetical protein